MLPKMIFMWFHVNSNLEFEFTKNSWSTRVENPWRIDEEAHEETPIKKLNLDVKSTESALLVARFHFVICGSQFGGLFYENESLW